VEDLKIINAIKACYRNDRKAQEIIYKHFFSYAMSIALRYSKNQEDAIEVLNDGFLKVFIQIKKFKINANFKAWLRTIIINTSIDKYRIKLKNAHIYLEEENQINQAISTSNILDHYNAEEIINTIQKLPEAYRFTFNLYEIEGYSHKEISKQLGINESKSRTYLSRSKKLLRQLLKENSKNETGS